MKKLFIIITLSITAAITFLSFTSASQNSDYQHLRISLQGTLIQISYSHAEFEQENIKKEKKDTYDMGPILKRVSEFESQGWEIVNSTSDNYNMDIHMKKSSN